MGEIAEGILQGIFCQACGCYMDNGDDPPGYPVSCSECEHSEADFDEYDGQPDEAQEWHDFDPDC